MLNKKIGVLALQGDFEEHTNALNTLNIENIEVRLTKDLKGLDGLIIPGGESSTILKLMEIYDLYELLINLGKDAFPMYGTCAGTIVLAREANNLKIKTFNLIDISVIRNGYGSQKNSFEEEIYFKKIDKYIPGIFIRAPIIKSAGEQVEILGKTKANHIVIAQQNNILVSTFHPELSESTEIHKYFVENMT